MASKQTSAARFFVEELLILKRWERAEGKIELVGAEGFPYTLGNGFG